MWGGTVEEKIEMDRTERKRMGKLSKQAKQRQQAGNAEVAQERRGKRSRLGGDGMWVCYVLCFAWSSL